METLLNFPLPIFLAHDPKFPVLKIKNIRRWCDKYLESNRDGTMNINKILIFMLCMFLRM